MDITRKEVEHIADLARLELGDTEKDMMKNQLSSVLEYVKQLQEVDTQGVTYQYQVKSLENALVEDEVDDCDREIRDRIQASFPDHVGDLLRVKNVFGE